MRDLMHRYPITFVYLLACVWLTALALIGDIPWSML